MIKIILIAVISWLIGIFGWAQIAGSLQNLQKSKKYLFTFVLWSSILIGVAYVGAEVFSSPWPLCVGYLISAFQVLRTGNVR